MKLYIKANDYKTVKNLDSLLPAYISKTSLFLQEEINPFYKISILSAKEIEEKKELLFYDNREIKKIVKGLYFGNSYCEHLLPSPLEIAKAKSHYNDRHHNFVFVFAPIASKINRAKEILQTLKELQVKEVVVNDYGMMHLALSEGFKPILGVNFTKTIKNTFIEHKMATEITKEQFKNQKELLKHLEFEISSYREFLKSLGIGRVSIENIEFDESFIVMEDWELFLRMAQWLGCLAGWCAINRSRMRIMKNAKPSLKRWVLTKNDPKIGQFDL